MLLQSSRKWQMRAVKPTVKVSFSQRITGRFDWCALYGRRHLQLGHMPLKSVTRLYSLVNCVKHNTYMILKKQNDKTCEWQKMCLSPHWHWRKNVWQLLTVLIYLHQKCNVWTYWISVVVCHFVSLFNDDEKENVIHPVRVKFWFINWSSFHWTS